MLHSQPQFEAEADRARLLLTQTPGSTDNPRIFVVLTASATCPPWSRPTLSRSRSLSNVPSPSMSESSSIYLLQQQKEWIARAARAETRL